MIKKRFFCIDAHTCGNPVRLVASGGPELEGSSIFEKRAFFLKNYDWIRKSLMFEPRGHDVMSGSILYPPSDPNNDFAVLFIETSGCLPMCGHGTIGTVTIAIEEGLIIPKIPGKIRMEAPAGLINISYTQNENNKVTSVSLDNVPSFLYAKDWTVEVKNLGNINFDIAYGGNFYAIIDPQPFFKGIQDYDASQLIAWSRQIRSAINERYEIIHPELNEIKGCSHILWTGETIHPSSTARNAVFYGEKGIDRSPCGTGTSARLAQWYFRGKCPRDVKFVHESYIGSTFIGEIINTTQVGDYEAIIPRITGWAKVYGYNTILVDPEDDPFAAGFQVL